MYDEEVCLALRDAATKGPFAAVGVGALHQIPYFRGAALMDRLSLMVSAEEGA